MSLSKKNMKNFRSPRSVASMLDHLPALVREQFLGKVELGDGFSDKLWKKSQELANKSLNTGFIRGIETGLLDPTAYGGYTVQDAVYCSNATEYFKEAKSKAAQDPILEPFLQGRITSFEHYTEDMFTEWHIASPTGISMGDAAKWYSTFERSVAYNKKPIYLLIAMLPCEALWGWLAEQIKNGINEKNVYSQWIKDNLGGKHHLANFIDANVSKYNINEQEALEIYQNGMRGEFQFFNSATEGSG